MAEDVLIPDDEKESTISSGNFYISKGIISIPFRVRDRNGSVIEVVGEMNEPKTNNLEVMDVYVPRVELDAIKKFFAQKDIIVEGTPWTTDDQEDYPGNFIINCFQLNNALREGSIVLKRTPNTDSYEFDGLDEFITDFVNEHQDQYEKEDEEINSMLNS